MKELEIDPRTRLTVVLCISFLSLILNHLNPMAVLLLITLLSVWLLAKGTSLAIFGNAKWIFIFFIFLSILQSVFQPSGRILLELYHFPILTYGGLEKGLLFFGRMTIIILSAGIVAKGGVRNITQGLIEWKIPYELAFMTAIAIRFLPSLRDEMQNSLNALQLRGINLKKVPFGEKIKIYTYLFSPVMSGVVIKAKELALAMEMKAFRAYSKRTSYIRLKFKKIDYFIISMSLVITLFF